MAKGGMCEKCQKNKATNLITDGKGEKTQVCAECAKNKPNNSDTEIKEFEEKWEKCLIENHHPSDYEATVEKIVTVAWCQENKKILEPYLQKLDIVEKSFPKGGMCWQYFFAKSVQDENYLKEVVNKTLEEVFGKKMREINDDKEKGDINYMWLPGHRLIDFVIKDKKLALQSYLRALDIKEKQLTGKWKSQEPNKDKPNIPDKKDQPKSDEICERCEKSCKKLISNDKAKGERTYKITFKQITCYRVDFVKEIHYFGTDCPCAEQFKLEHHWTCPKCGTRDWPDLKKGWVLDYEIKNCFCSAKCHVEYRQLKWEEAQKLTQVELPPPELEISANEGQNIDREKEGLKRTILFLRTYADEMEQRLNNNQNLTPEQRQLSDYIRNLQQNTLRRAEDNYRSRYGELTEDGSNKEKGMSGGMIALIVIGILALVGGLIFLLTRNKKKIK